MGVGNYKIIFALIVLISVSIIIIPVITVFFPLPAGEPFSELYLLGPDHRAENYPSNIVVGSSYSIFVGVGNHQGSTTKYVLYVKVLNQTDLLPNANLNTPSSISPANTFEFTIPNNQTWEEKLNFSVVNATFSEDNSQINIFQINDVPFTVNKPVAWDSNSSAFKFQLLFELWIFNSQSQVASYDGRYVGLHLNLTRTV